MQAEAASPPHLLPFCLLPCPPRSLVCGRRWGWPKRLAWSWERAEASRCTCALLPLLNGCLGLASRPAVLGQ